MIKIDIFSDDNDINIITLDDEEVYGALHGMRGSNASITGTLTVHMDSFITRQNLLQFDAPRDLIIITDDKKTTLGEHYRFLLENMFSQGHAFTSFSDSSFFIPESELYRLENKQFIQERTNERGFLSYKWKKLYQ